MSSSSSAGRRRARGCVAGEKDDRSVCMDACGDGRSAPLLLPVLSERYVRSPPVWDSDRGRCTTLTPQRNVESVMNLLLRLERKSAGEFVPVRVANEQVCARRTTDRTLPRRPPYASLLCGLRPHRCLPANIVGGGCCEIVWRTKNLRHTSYDATIGGPPAPKGFHLSQEIWKNREPSRTDLLPRIHEATNHSAYESALRPGRGTSSLTFAFLGEVTKSVKSYCVARVLRHLSNRACTDAILPAPSVRLL